LTYSAWQKVGDLPFHLFSFAISAYFLPFRLIAVSPFATSPCCHFALSPFHLIVILPYCHFAFSHFAFCLLVISPRCHFAISFAISPSSHFAFCHFALSPFRLLPFRLIAISPSCHFALSPFCLIAISPFAISPYCRLPVFYMYMYQWRIQDLGERVLYIEIQAISRMFPIFQSISSL
jgi:hypothetical protein